MLVHIAMTERVIRRIVDYHEEIPVLLTLTNGYRIAKGLSWCAEHMDK